MPFHKQNLYCYIQKNQKNKTKLNAFEDTQDTYILVQIRHKILAMSYHLTKTDL